MTKAREEELFKMVSETNMLMKAYVELVRDVGKILLENSLEKERLMETWKIKARLYMDNQEILNKEMEKIMHGK